MSQARKSLTINADFREIRNDDIRRVALIVEALSGCYTSDRTRILRAALQLVQMPDPYEGR